MPAGCRWRVRHNLRKHGCPLGCSYTDNATDPWPILEGLSEGLDAVAERWSNDPTLQVACRTSCATRASLRVPGAAAEPLLRLWLG